MNAIPPLGCFQVLADAGDLDGAFETAGALVAATSSPPNTPSRRVGGRNPSGTAGRGGIADAGGAAESIILDLAAAKMLCSLEDCSDRSLDLLESIAGRCVRFWDFERSWAAVLRLASGGGGGISAGAWTSSR